MTTIKSIEGLPAWGVVEDKLNGGEEVTRLEQFIHDHEPADPAEEEEWRGALAAVIAETVAPQNARIAELEVDIQKLRAPQEYIAALAKQSDMWMARCRIAEAALAAQGAEPVGWQERQKFGSGHWSEWYGRGLRSLSDPMTVTHGHVVYEFRPIYAARPPAAEQAAQRQARIAAAIAQNGSNTEQLEAQFAQQVADDAGPAAGQAEALKDGNECLKEKVKDLEDWLHEAREQRDDYMAERDKLLTEGVAEFQALKTDAARYRWLRKGDYPVSPVNEAAIEAAIAIAEGGAQCHREYRPDTDSCQATEIRRCRICGRHDDAANLRAVMQEAVDRFDGLKGGAVSETIAMMRATIASAEGGSKS